MHEDPHGLRQPYRVDADRTSVIVTLDGRTFPGVVLGWRGPRVFVQYSSDLGNHQTWVPSTDVVRTG